MKKTRLIKAVVAAVIVCLMAISMIPIAFAAGSDLLADISVTNAQLSPAFHPNSYNYKMVTDIGYTSSTVTVRPDDPAASVTINGANTKSITLGLGGTDVHVATITVVSSDGSASMTYTINLEPRSNNANLSGIDTFGSVLYPAFSPDILNYTVAPIYHSLSTTVCPVVADPFAAFKMDGQDKDAVKVSTTDSTCAKTTAIEVTAADGVTKKTYTITATDSNANLQGISVGMMFGGSISPDFNPDTTYYIAKLAPVVTYIQLTFTPADWRSTVKVNGTQLPETSGSTGYTMNLGNAGNDASSANVVVTAPDGKTTKTYLVVLSDSTTTEFNPPKTGTVVNCTSGVNIRLGPGTNYSAIGTAPKGATYTVTGQSGSWYRVIYNNQTGYISSSYLSLSSTPPPPPPSTQTGTVVNCTTAVNVRSGPGTTYSIIGSAVKGAKYTVTGQSGSWYKIDYNGKVGYISSSYLSVSSTPPPPPSTQTGTVVNCTTAVNVRSGPGTTYSIIGSAPKGATYTVTGQSGSWYKIDYNGTTGYISSSYFSVSST